DPEKLGEFLQKDNISVHYFCLVISCLRGASPTEVSMDSCLKTSKRRQLGLLGRSALCARKREPLSTARRISASETSICLVAKKGVAFHNFLESTNHFVTNIAQHRTSNMGMWGRKAASCVVKTYPNRVLRISRARVVVKPSTTASAYRNMPTHQQSISSNVHSNGNSYSRQEVVPHSVCYMRIPWNPQELLLS
uniref:PHD finger protein 7 n=1 Tax=Colobus angolensis palliatus TaxID=336983 RepID=A0A2K5JKM6_COLAP